MNNPRCTECGCHRPEAPAPRVQPLEIQSMNRPLDPDVAAARIRKLHPPVDWPEGFAPRPVTVTGNNMPASSRPHLNRTALGQPADPAPRDTQPDDDDGPYDHLLIGKHQAEVNRQREAAQSQSSVTSPKKQKTPNQKGS